MKINPPRSRTKKILIPLLVVILVGLGGYVAYAYANGQWPFRDDSTTSSSQPDTSSSKKSDESDELNASDSEGNGATSDPTDSSTTTTPKTPQSNAPSDDPADNDSRLTARISALTQNGSTLQVRTLIEAVTDKGTCSLKATDNDQTITRSAGIQAQASSSTCKGFDIPVSPGTWHIVLTISSGGKSITLTRDIVIK